MPPQSDEQSIKALATLLEAKGLDASDFLDVINALGKIKKRDQEKSEKSQNQEDEENKRKIFVDKEFVFDTRRDVFIYRDGRTKGGRYHVRIYDEKTKKVHKESLWTSNRIEALAKAERIYAENKDRMRRGVKLVSITTKELVNLYLKERFSEITTIPHQGITYSSYDNLAKKLKHWIAYINEKNLKNTHIEDIPPEIGKGFATWLLEKPKDVHTSTTERSRETINSNVAAVKKMYKDVALEGRYITATEMPQFKYLKVQRDQSPKRDILTEEEYNAIRKWMHYTWTREKEISDDERLKRQLYSNFFAVHHNTGARSKEILGITWGNVSVIPTDKEEDKRIRRAIYIAPSNSKTGKGRYIVAPIAEYLDRIKRIYRSLGIECSKNEYVFQHISKTRRGKNVPWGQPLIEKRLRSVCEGSATDGCWSPDGRKITNYSARHYYATTSLMRKVDIYDLAINMGTSLTYIEQTYSHVTALMKSDELTKGQGLYQLIEDKIDKSRTYEITKDFGVKQGCLEHRETGMKVHYEEYYRGLDTEEKMKDDMFWLLVLLQDNRSSTEDIAEMHKSVIERWGNSEWERFAKENPDDCYSRLSKVLELNNA